MALDEFGLDDLGLGGADSIGDYSDEGYVGGGFNDNGGGIMTSSDNYFTDSIWPKLENTFNRGLDYYLGELWDGENNSGVYDGYAERFAPAPNQPKEPGFNFTEPANMALIAGLVLAGFLVVKVIK